jgi:hypothetical protein
MTKQPRINRNIRLNDEEWQIFREDMGAEWLRSEIAKVRAKKLKAATKAA